MSFWTDKRVAVTGGKGFVGKCVINKLLHNGVDPVNLFVPRYDLRSAANAGRLFFEFRPNVVIHLAARVGGIGANSENPGIFFFDNIKMGAELMDAARRYSLEKFVQIGTVCSYPKHTSVPFKEEDLWNGYPEETNAPYGIAKKALLTMGQAYRQQYGMNVIHVIPVNMYGPGDNFDLETSHVIPALIRKFAEAKLNNEPRVTLWGTGNATREFLYVGDAADGIVKAAELYNSAKPVNLGVGHEISIASLAWIIREKIGYEGEFVFDLTKPDGQPRRALDVQRAVSEFGWSATTAISVGLDATIKWYYENIYERLIDVKD